MDHSKPLDLWPAEPGGVSPEREFSDIVRETKEGKGFEPSKGLDDP